MTGERGWCWVWISLAPNLPPRVQALTLESVLPLSPALQAAAEQLAALTAHPTRRGLARLLSAAADQATLWERVQLVSLLCGPCVVEEIIASDGTTHATLRMAGPKGGVEASLTLAGRRSKLLDAEFYWPQSR
jgi:hypothetical protein